MKMTKRKRLKLSERVVIDRKAIIPFDFFCCLGMAGLESMMAEQDHAGNFDVISIV